MCVRRTATRTSRITVTTTTASVLRVPCHAGIRRVTSAESARVSSPSLSCVGSVLPRKQQTRSGQIKNQPGGSGRPQGSNAPPGFLVAGDINRSGTHRLVSFRHRPSTRSSNPQRQRHTLKSGVQPSSHATFGCRERASVAQTEASWNPMQKCSGHIVRRDKSTTEIPALFPDT